MSTEEDYREWHEYEVLKSREEGLQAVARKMIAEGLPADLVARCTGLSLESIGKLYD